MTTVRYHARRRTSRQPSTSSADCVQRYVCVRETNEECPDGPDRRQERDVHLLRLPVRRHRTAREPRPHRQSRACLHARPRVVLQPPGWSTSCRRRSSTAGPPHVDAALEAAAAILDRADMPLVYGLGNSTCESQRAAMMLAERIGGVIDSHTSLTHGPTKIAGQLVGKLTCTLGEVMNRADLVVYWGTNPVETPPAPLHQVHADAEGQVRARRTQGSDDGAGGRSRDAEREGQRPVPADSAGRRSRSADGAASPGQRSSRRPPPCRGHRRDRRSARGSGRADEARPLRRVLLRQRPDA